VILVVAVLGFVLIFFGSAGERMTDSLIVTGFSLLGFVIGYVFAHRQVRQWTEQVTRKIQEDEAVYARVVRQFYFDNPVLTNGVWKQVNPKITPPWHKEEK
jgi:vacuolar-type H+-ATPase subunit F/Vma7